MLRIHFTVADAMKVRVVVLGAFAELLESFGKLTGPGDGRLFGRWRARTVAQARALSPDVRELARFIVPPTHGMADLFTVVGPTDEYTEAVERLVASPAEALRAELGYAPLIGGPRSGWIADFADGGRVARQRMTGALDGYHEVAIAPYWPRIRAVLENERTTRLGIMARDGLGAMLEGLAPPLLRWSPPVLEMPKYHPSSLEKNTDIYLEGRGLVVVPSLFAAADPGVFTPWGDGPVQLIYQVPLDAPTALRLWRDPGTPDDRAVSTLLGTTRAAALRVVAGGCTTSELARRLNISPGGASQHATVLRESGLIISRRHRNTMRHTITRLGLDLLNSA
ncbi:DNA-binding transcriptional ArsR family regulator [Actinoplanes tereljensis]|uniref:Transcriptional regulator n=1 Tax=Paractinoplanes tereljensis TaxID=571912 RepID=A0A919TXE4_9ACTN|nr:winged helix-turn-helix domain-containing protein [Actinoplanes tereljensis]GIF23812.1 transcriptional regulator [Actinoplanes tereljensis]